MNLNARYTWEAEMPDGSVITTGGDVKGCVRFSFIPAPGTGLPRHDITGVPMLRRFNRGFVKGTGGGMKGYIYCLICRYCRFYVSASTGEMLVTPVDYELYL